VDKGQHIVTKPLFTGNVGIAVTSPPKQLLHLAKQTSDFAIRMERTDLATGGYFDMNLGIRNSSLGLFFDSDVTQNIISALPNGNVGIGTSAPGAPLHINKPGTLGSRTTVLTLSSGTSKRPTLQFSEENTGNYNDGMSLEYDGSMLAGENQININDVVGDPVVTFKSNGRVGIGTTNPFDELHILDPIANANVGIESSTGTAALFLTSGANSQSYLSYNTDLHIGTGGVLGSAIAPKMTFDEAGNVGVGTTSPQAVLDVRKSSFCSPIALKLSQSAYVCAPFSASTPIMLVEQETLLPGSSITKFIINTNGNVGVNTNDPLTDLHVDGEVLIGDASVCLPPGYSLYVQTGILTEKLKVAVNCSSDWADWVFSDDYDLMTLEAKEAFIKKHHHLPGFDAAQAIVENGGIDVLDIIVKQQVALEENTLHIIGLNKQVQEQQRKMKQQDERIEKLEHLIFNNN
jgi:hypothetical protein